MMRRSHKFFSQFVSAGVIVAGPRAPRLRSPRRPPRLTRRSNELIGSNDVGGSTFLGTRASSAARSGSSPITTIMIVVGAETLATAFAVRNGRHHRHDDNWWR